jgi:hypothetical protein
MFTYVFMTPERVCAQYVRVRTCARMHIYKHTESHKYVYASCLQEHVLHTTYHIHKNKYCILHTTFNKDANPHATHACAGPNLLPAFGGTGTHATATIQHKHGTLYGRNGVGHERLVVKGAQRCLQYVC